MTKYLLIALMLTGCASTQYINKPCITSLQDPQKLLELAGSDKELIKRVLINYERLAADRDYYYGLAKECTTP